MAKVCNIKYSLILDCKSDKYLHKHYHMIRAMLYINDFFYKYKVHTKIIPMLQMQEQKWKK